LPASSLLALIDDIASVLDDVAVLTKIATKKTAGVLGDDLALNAQQVTGVAPDRELSVVWAVAKGSAINKVILVPAALVVSAAYPPAVAPLLMLGGGFLNSRLATRIREKEGISYGVGSVLQASPFEKNGTFYLYAIFAPENATRLEAAYKEELTRALKEGFTEDELKSAKSGLLQARQVQRAADGSLAQMLVGGLFTDRTLAWDAEMDKKIEALDGKSVQAALKKALDPATFSAAKAGDFAVKKGMLKP